MRFLPIENVYSIRLYKTPLDTSYRNVYDGFSIPSQYNTFLQAVFADNRRGILIQNAKSRQDFNGEFVLQVSGYTSMQLHDYNYLSFLTDGELDETDKAYRFAFILSCNSLNDGENSAACELRCKLDPWGSELMYKVDRNLYSASRCTCDLTKRENQLRYSPTIPQFDIYRTVNADYLSKYMRTVYGSNKNIRVLWLRLYLDFGINAVEFGGTLNVEPIYGLSRDEYAVVELPVCIMDGVKPIYNCTVRYGTFSSHTTRYREFTQTIDFPRQGLELQGEYLSKAELTFLPMFKYVVQYTQSSGNDIYTIYPQGSDIGMIEIDTQHKPYQSTNFVAYSHLVSSGIWNFDDYIVIPIKRYTPVPSLYSSAEQYEEIMGEPEKYLYEACQYPYVRTGLITKEGFTPILATTDLYSDSRDYDCYLILKRYGAKDFSYYIASYLDVEQIYNYRRTSTNGTLSITSDSLDMFLNRNRNQLIAGAISTGISALSSILGGVTNVGVGMATGNPFMVAQGAKSFSGTAGSAISSLIAMQAHYLDVKNYPAIMNYAVDNASSDIYLQDDIAIVDQTAIPYKLLDIREQLNELHEYGTDFPVRVKIHERRRDVFDYVQLAEDLRVAGLNTEDYNEMNSAFRRGIRMWHAGYGSLQDTTRMEILRTFNTNTINKSIIT